MENKKNLQLGEDIVEELFKKDPKLVYLLCPSLEPPKFCYYLKNQLKGKLLTEVLTMFNLPRYGKKEDKLKRLFCYFYPESYPETEIPFVLDNNDKFIKIIQSIVEQTPPVVPKSFLSFFNRKEDFNALKQRVSTKTVVEIKQFLKLVDCEQGGQKKDDKVDRVMKYLRPDLPNQSPAEKNILTEKPVQPTTPKESKKRKITGGEEMKQGKRSKTENQNTVEEKLKSTPGGKGPIHPEGSPVVEVEEKLEVESMPVQGNLQDRKKEFNNLWKVFKREKESQFSEQLSELSEALVKLNSQFKISYKVLIILKKNVIEQLEKDDSLPSSSELETEYKKLEDFVKKFSDSPLLDE